MALKLMQVCKYFRHKEFLYFVVKNITAYDDGFYYLALDGGSDEWETIDDIPDNLWITEMLSSDLLPETHFVSQLIPKIAVCEAREIVLEDEKISMVEFKTLISNVKEIDLKRTIIYEENSEMVPLEDILKSIPAIENFYCASLISSFSTIDAAKELALPNLKYFHLHLIPLDFNVEAFIEFMREHRTVEFVLYYHPSSYCPHAELLQNYITETAQAGDDEYVQPDVTFPDHV